MATASISTELAACLPNPILKETKFQWKDEPSWDSSSSSSIGEELDFKSRVHRMSSTTASPTPSSIEFEYVAGILLALKSASPPLNPVSRKRSRVADVEGDGSLPIALSMKSANESNDEKNDSHDEDDEYLNNEIHEEEDDDEWLDSAGPRLTPGGRRRKKAMSGTACSKHKRWKKRCPDDCQMRSPEHRHGDCLLMDGEGGEYIGIGEGEDSVEDSAQDISEPDVDGNSFRDLVLHFRKNQEVPFVDEDDHSDADDAECIDEGDGRKLMGSRSSRRRSFWNGSTIACHRHTSLHARCPPNCIDRRPAKPHPRSKKARLEKEIIMMKLLDDKLLRDRDDSRISQSQPFSQVANSSTHRKTFTKREDPPSPSPVDPPSPCDTRKTLTKRCRASTRSTSRKMGSSGSRSVRAGRKYLPQACDRHKVLHARCPANCPDRIKRDAEMLGSRFGKMKQMDPTEDESTDSGTDFMDHSESLD